MRVVQLNLAWDIALRDPEHLLDTYHTLTGWSDALAAAGAAVHVVQRFSRDATVRRGIVTYQFVRDDSPPMLPPSDSAALAVATVGRLAPDVVHVNGLMFPRAVREVRAAARDAVIALQDHSGTMPRRDVWPLRRAQFAEWRAAFLDADACLFTANALAERWHRIGLPSELPVFEIPEASTTLAMSGAPRSAVGPSLPGNPRVLWVGRFTASKDPETVLAGFARALARVPDARLTMIVSEPNHCAEAQRRIRAFSSLRDAVSLVGPVTHTEMAGYFAASDIFVSGSRHEGSGYALIEAMAFGVVPCVSDIPAHRAIVGDAGSLWTAGEPDALAAALCSLAAHARGLREQVRQRFDERLGWPVLGRRLFDIYVDLVRRRALRRHA